MALSDEIWCRLNCSFLELFLINRLYFLIVICNCDFIGYLLIEILETWDLFDQDLFIIFAAKISRSLDHFTSSPKVIFCLVHYHFLPLNTWAVVIIDFGQFYSTYFVLLTAFFGIHLLLKFSNGAQRLYFLLDRLEVLSIFYLGYHFNDDLLVFFELGGVSWVKVTKIKRFVQCSIIVWRRSHFWLVNLCSPISCRKDSRSHGTFGWVRTVFGSWMLSWPSSFSRCDW